MTQATLTPAILPAYRAPELHSPFSTADLDSIVAGAVRVLDEIGVQCVSPAVREWLLRVPGLRAAEDRIYFAPALSESLLAIFRAQAATPPTGPAPARFTLTGPWCCLERADSTTNRVAPATTAQVVDAIRLLEALNVVVTVAPLEAAADTPPALRNLAGLRSVLLHSRAGTALTNLPSPDQFAAVAAMSSAAGRTASVFLVPMISPLKLECTVLENVLTLPAQPGFRLRLAAGLPAIGSTAPLHLPGALMQSLAETLAVHACARAFDLPCDVAPIRSDPFDLRYANYVVGSPEYGLLDSAARALHRHLTGQAPISGAFRSMGKLPDAQAQQERSTNLLFQALQGARRFSAVGQLSMDEVFSPEQAVLDVEMARGVERFTQGLPWHGAAGKTGGMADALDCIARGVAEGQFLDAPETLARYRTAFHHSTLFRYENLGTWQRRGSVTILDAAGAHIRELLAAAPACRLEPGAAREVERVFARVAAS